MLSIHPTAIIDAPVDIGDGVSIWHFCHVSKGTQIGKDCVLGQNVTVGPDVRIGDGCKIQNNVSIYRGVTLEDQVFVGPSVVFTNVINPRAFIPRMAELRTTIVHTGASLGANSTIVCGVSIGRYAMVGAGAVVTRDVPNFAVVYGNPARVHGWVCRCGVRLAELMQDEWRAEGIGDTCRACGGSYIRVGHGIAEA